jgi:uncharacterized protein HemX
MQNEIIPIETVLTPTSVWNAAAVIVALLAVVVLVYKVIEIGRKEHERKLKQRTIGTGGKDLTDEIAEKVMAKLEPRLANIEAKLQRDKNRLESHEIAISNILETQKDTMKYQEVSCQALIAVLDHELHNGNEDQMQTARDAMNNYLIHRRG